MPPPHISLFSEEKEAGSPEDDDHLVEPSRPKKKMPKRGRSLSYKPHYKDNRKRAKSVPPSEDDPVSDITSDTVGLESGGLQKDVLDNGGLQHHVFTRGATSKVSNAVLKSNLKSSYIQLASTKSSSDEKDRQLDLLTRKNVQLTELVRTTRQLARDNRNTASAELKQASITSRKANSAMDALHETIQEKESALFKQKEQLESKMMSSIAAAVQKEKVSTILFLLACQHYQTPIKHANVFLYQQTRSERHLFSIQKKFDSVLAKTKKEHEIELADKDKQIKVKCNVVLTIDQPLLPFSHICTAPVTYMYCHIYPIIS